MSTNANVNKNKIGLVGCIITSMGAIIGAGIFGALPAAINSVGHGVVIALIASVIYILAQSIPNMYSNSVIPASGSFFLWAAKIIHPSAGLLMAFLNLLQPFMIAAFATLFADYFITLIPSTSDYKIIISLTILMIYAVVAWFGNYTFVSINSIFVILLLCAMFTYIIFGLAVIDIDKIDPVKIIKPGMSLTSFGTAIGLLFSTLSGGGTISQISENIKNPRKTIPIAILISPIIVSFIYICMAIVTLGVMSDAELTTLAQVGQKFLGPKLLTFFIVCGPLIGVLTAMAPVIMFSSAQIQAAADCGIYPNFVKRRNKYGISPAILIFTIGFSMICVSTGISYSLLLTIASFFQSISTTLNCLVPFFLYKKYPNACNCSRIFLNRYLVYVVAVFSFIYSGYLVISMILSLNKIIWLTVLAAIFIVTVYFVVRFRYCNRMDYSLMQNLKKPVTEWEEYERQCKIADSSNISKKENLG